MAFGHTGRRDAFVVAAALSAVAALAFFEISDPDLGFHLATGRAVLASGHIPAVNVLSFAQPEQPWLLQQWLPATLFELAFREGGAAAVIALKMALVVATFALALATALRLGATLALAAPVVVLAAWAASFRFVERPLLFSNLALAAVALLLAGAERARERGAAPGRVARPLAGAGLVAAAACHLHAGAVFSLLLLGAVAVGLAIERRPRAALAVAGTGVAALALAAATLALYHPWGARVLAVPFAMGTENYLAEHLIEFRPPWHAPFEVTKAFWALFGLAALIATARARRLPASRLASLLLFAALALRFVRLVDAFAVVAAPILAAALGDWVRERQGRAAVAPEGRAAVASEGRAAVAPEGRAAVASEGREAVAPDTRGLVARVSRVSLVALVLLAPLDHWSLFTPRIGFAEPLWPTRLLGFVERAGLRGPAFVSDGWAGPFLAAFYPRERVFFFPNFEAFSPGFYREYQDVRYGLPGWDAKLDHYGIELVLLKYTSPTERRFQGGADNLRQKLAGDPRWTLVAFDDVGEAFVRRDGVNAAAAARLGIPGVDPDRSRPRASRLDVGR